LNGAWSTKMLADLSYVGNQNRRDAKLAAAQVEQNANGPPERTTVMESTINAREEEAAACGAMGTGQ
jgi:hypothetical protein